MEPFCERIAPPNDRFPIRLFRRSSMDEYVHVHPHWHDAYEILLILKGKGSQQIGPHLFSFEKGDILPIPCGAVHSTYTDQNEENEILVISFPWDFPAPGMLYGPELLVLSRFRDGLNMPVMIRSHADKSGGMAKLLLDMEREWQGVAPGKELLIRARLLEWVVQMERLGRFNGERRNASDAPREKGDKVSAHVETFFLEKEQGQKERTRDALRKVFELIDARFDENLRVSDAARVACLSVSQLERLFKAHTGRGFVQYLNRYRIAKACERIPMNESLTEIALSCGFNSLSSFSRAFRKVRGMSPSEMR